MILVVGASSMLGSRVVTRLRERGLAVRAMSRNPDSKLAGLEGADVQVVQGDLRDRPSLDRALVGVDAVLASAHGVLPFDRKNTIVMVDGRGNRSLIDAAVDAGVRHFVFISVHMASPDGPSMLGRLKGESEQYLRSSGLAATVVRPTAFVETHILDMFGRPLLDGGKVRIFGHGRTKLNYVAVDDVADLVTQEIVDGPPPKFRSIDIGGPDDLTRLETIDLLERALGTTAGRSHVPVPLMQVMRVAARPVNPSLSYLIDTVLMEETHPELCAYHPGEGRVVGPTAASVVIEKWAATRGSAPSTG